MTPSKEALLAKMNQQAQADYEEALDKARRGSRRAPAAPVPVTAESLEFPKWVYGAGGASKLVENDAELKALGAGWADSPAAVKADTKKKE